MQRKDRDKLLSLFTSPEFAGPSSPWCAFRIRIVAKIFSFLLFAACCLSASAQRTIQVPADYTKIQDAIGAAVDGDTVLIAPGTYYENLDFSGKAITVTSSAGPSTTIINGSFKAPVVSFQSQETRASILSNLTLEYGGTTLDYKGDPSTTGGVYVGPQASPTILNNVLTTNSCAGVYSNSGNPLIDGNEITKTLFNAAFLCLPPGGPAISLNGGSYATPFKDLTPVVIGNTIEENNAPEAVSATGIYIFGSTSAIIENNIIRNNLSGGIGTAFSMNDPSSGGGGSANTAGVLLFLQNLVYGNKATKGDGGLRLFFNSAGDTPALSLIANNTISNNTGFLSASSATLPSSTQVDLQQALSPVSLVNNIILGSGSMPAVNCVSTKGFDNPTPPVLDTNDIFNGTGAALGGSCDGLGDLSFNPRFTDASTGDFHLLPVSAAIDAGKNSVLYLQTKDIEGNTRPVDATGQGYPIVDLGAYEAQGTVDANPTTITLTPSSISVNAGTTIDLVAQLNSANGVPTGTVAFLEDEKPLGSAMIAGDGSASVTTPLLTPGVHLFTASYAGEGQFTPAIPVKVYVFVGKYTPTINLTSDINPSTFGQTVTFTITVRTPDHALLTPIVLDDVTGTQITLDEPTPDANGNAVSKISNLSVGIHHLVAIFPGDESHVSVEAAYTQEVKPGLTSSLAFNCTPNPAGSDQSINLAAMVTGSSGTPAGTVNVTFNGNAYATLVLNGTGSASGIFPPLPIGTDTLVATYATTNGYALSSSACLIDVHLATSITHLSANPSPSPLGKPVTLTAAITGSDGTTSLTGGSVAFSSSLGGPLGSFSVNAAGTAQTTLSNLPAGQQQMTATFSGIGSHGPSSATIPLDITLGDDSLSLSATPLRTTSYQPVTLKAQFQTDPVSSRVAGNTILFTANGNSLGPAVTDANGNASVVTSALTTGTYSLGASFAGTSSYAASNAALVSETIDPAPTALTLTANSATAFHSQPVTLTATVTAPGTTAVPTGTITITDTSTSAVLASQSVSAQGTVSAPISSLAIGSHTLAATYTPLNQIFAPSSTSTPATVTIEPQDFTVAAAETSITIKTEYHADLDLMVTSLGGLSDTIALSCANLPAYVTCRFAPSAATLKLDAPTPVTLTLDTDALQDFRSDSSTPGNRPFGLAVPIAFCSLLFFFLPRIRNRLRLLGLIAMFALLSSTGCSGHLPAHTAPGTYHVTVNGYSPVLNQSRSFDLTVVVTE